MFRNLNKYESRNVLYIRLVNAMLEFTWDFFVKYVVIREFSEISPSLVLIFVKKNIEGCKYLPIFVL